MGFENRIGHVDQFDLDAYLQPIQNMSHLFLLHRYSQSLSVSRKNVCTTAKIKLVHLKYMNKNREKIQKVYLLLPCKL